jgi:vitamin B12 transporter
VDDQFNTAPLQRDSGVCGDLEPALRLGTSYALSSHVELLANAGRYVRMPTLSELYGMSPLVQGTPALVPETGQTVDVGTRVAIDSAAGRYGLDTFAFARFAQDMIRYRTTSFGVAAPYNVASARILGVEAAVSGEWLRALRARVAVTAMDPRDTVDNAATNDILPLTPRLSLSTRLEAFATRGLAALRQDRVLLAAIYTHRSSRYADEGGQNVLPEQNFVDLEATTSHLGGTLIGRAAVRNVFDAQLADVLGMPLPGRSFHAEVEAWW